MNNQNNDFISFVYKNYEINIKKENNDWYSYSSLPYNVQHHIFSLRWYKDFDIIIVMSIVDSFIKFFDTRKDISSKAPFYLGVDADHSAAQRLLNLKDIKKSLLLLGYNEEARKIHLECEKTFNSINNEKTYRFFSNHALMSDLALLNYMNDFNKDNNEIVRVFNRIIKNLEVIFDFETGACREHSISYQEYNLNLIFIINENAKKHKKNNSNLNGLAISIGLLYEKVKIFSRYLLYAAYIDGRGYIPLGDTFESVKSHILNRIYKVESPEHLLENSYKNLVFFSESFGSYIYKSKEMSVTLHNSMHSAIHKQDDDLSFTLTVLGNPIFLDGGHHDIYTKQFHLKSTNCHSLPFFPNKIMDNPIKVENKPKLIIEKEGLKVIGSHYRYSSFSVKRIIDIAVGNIRVIDSVLPLSYFSSQYILSPHAEILESSENLFMIKVNSIILELKFSCKANIEKTTIIYSGEVKNVDKIVFENFGSIEVLISIPQLYNEEKDLDFNLIIDNFFIKEDLNKIEEENVTKNYAPNKLVDLESSSLLKRNITIENNKIKFITEKVDGIEYAFYLGHSNGTERKNFSSKSEVFFDIPTVSGDYSARFLYKKNKVLEKKRLYFNIDKSKKVTSAEVLEIVNEDNYSIEYYPKNSEITFIVFNKDGTDKFTVPFALFFLLKLGFNVIAIKQNNDKYQSLSFSTFKNIVSPLVEGKKVFLYGSSLGGYCAAYYAGAVNGVVIAAAPRNSFHPVLASKQKSNSFYKHSNITDNIISEKYMLVIVDPNHEKDKFFIEQVILPAYPKLNLIELPDVGHEVLFHINYTKQLKKLILDIVYERYDDVSINRNLESPYQYRAISLKCFNEKDYRKAIYYAGRVLNESVGKSIDKQMIYIINKSLSKLNL